MTKQTDSWNPDVYERFQAERRQPFLDLIELIEPAPAMRIADLGCGTGEGSATLHAKFAAKETVGIDLSPAMLARAAARTVDWLTFRQADLASFTETAAYDLIVSNAALHWVPDHPDMFARIRAALRPGGQIAIQIPANFDQPSHRVAADTAREEPFREALGGFEHVEHGLAPEEYARLLHRLGFARQTVRLQVYGHLLSGPEQVVDWVRGTLFTAYFQRLPVELHAAFAERYQKKLLAMVEDTRPFFFPYKRILMWGSIAD